jgi:hypothetical protein
VAGNLRLSGGTFIAWFANMRLWAFCVVWCAVAIACGGDVMIEGENGEMIPVEDDGGDTSSGGKGKGDGSCIPCNGGDCGLCALEAGDVLYRCPGGHPPDIGVACLQTGSVFHAPDGSSYVCWRCD